MISRMLGFLPEMCTQKPASVLKANQGHARGRSDIGAELELVSISPSPVQLWLPFHLVRSLVVTCCAGVISVLRVVSL
jgi:hypothetical protein